MVLDYNGVEYNNEAGEKTSGTHDLPRAALRQPALEPSQDHLHEQEVQGREQK